MGNNYSSNIIVSHDDLKSILYCKAVILHANAHGRGNMFPPMENTTTEQSDYYSMNSNIIDKYIQDYILNSYVNYEDFIDYFGESPKMKFNGVISLSRIYEKYPEWFVDLINKKIDFFNNRFLSRYCEIS